MRPFFVDFSCPFPSLKSFSFLLHIYFKAAEAPGPICISFGFSRYDFETKLNFDTVMI
jgi:hypothetical protein